jgi:hypothetical protein
VGDRPTLGSSDHTELHRFRPEISWSLIIDPPVNSYPVNSCNS